MTLLLCAGKPYNHSTDIYSVAIVCWQIGCNRDPFPGAQNKFQLRKAIIGGKRPEFADAVWAFAPPGLALMLQQCWQPNPGRRPSAAVVLNFFKKSLVEDIDTEASWSDTEQTEKTPSVSSKPLKDYL